MSKKIHNKKRNVGILYDLLARKVSQGLVENNHDLVNQAMTVIKENFTKTSCLLQEYRMFSDLSKTTIETDHIGSRMLEEMKNSLEKIDSGNLETEKSKLIKTINKTFDDSDFFNTKIPGYKDHATVQILLNAWRDPGRFGPAKIAEYEQKVLNMLKEEKSHADIEDEKTSEVDPLTVKLMTEKFNKKFKSLNDTQKKLTEKTLSGQADQAKVLMKESLMHAKNSIKTLKKSETSEWILKKVDKIETVIESLNPEDTSEENIKKFMTLSQLTETIKSD